jgi:hypothetical protein
MAITLRFSTSHGLQSALIRWRTDAHVSHVEYERSDGWTLGSRLVGGVALRPPASCDGQYNVAHATFDGIDRAYEWGLANRLSRPYDAWGIVGVATAKDWHNKRGRFCSEFILESAEAAGTWLLNSITKMWQITPRDLGVSPLLHILDGPPLFVRLHT